MIIRFINEYGNMIVYTIITAIAGYIGLILKKIYEEKANNKIKKDICKTCVKAAEQIYKDLHGSEKLEKAIEAASEMLNAKGIQSSELELRMLIESALAEFNKVFEK